MGEVGEAQRRRGGGPGAVDGQKLGNHGDTKNGDGRSDQSPDGYGGGDPHDFDTVNGGEKIFGAVNFS